MPAQARTLIRTRTRRVIPRRASAQAHEHRHATHNDDKGEQRKVAYPRGALVPGCTRSIPPRPGAFPFSQSPRSLKAHNLAPSRAENRHKPRGLRHPTVTTDASRPPPAATAAQGTGTCGHCGTPRRTIPNGWLPRSRATPRTAVVHGGFSACRRGVSPWVVARVLLPWGCLAAVSASGHARCVLVVALVSSLGCSGSLFRLPPLPLLVFPPVPSATRPRPVRPWIRPGRVSPGRAKGGSEGPAHGEGLRAEGRTPGMQRRHACAIASSTSAGIGLTHPFASPRRRP